MMCLALFKIELSSNALRAAARSAIDELPIGNNGFTDLPDTAMKDDSQLMHRDITDPIISAFYEVYNALPYGLPEAVFHRAMQVALRKRGLKFETQKPLRVYFCGELVGRFRADLIVEERVIVEIKTAVRIADAHVNQLAGYLPIAELQVGLVMNFGPEPTFKRYFRESRADKSSLNLAPDKSVNPIDPEFPKGS